MKVAVLGCGPAGLLAAEAAQRKGHCVHIFSRKVKSVLPGAQYLHRAIPDLSVPSDQILIHYEKIGTREGYAEKVYGSPDAPCSWDAFPEGEVLAWSIHRAYDRLWSMWNGRIFNTELSNAPMGELLSNYDKVISTIPAPLLCVNHWHKFDGQKVWITNSAHIMCAPYTIVYNGSPRWQWYRTCNINGHGSTEYSREPSDTDRIWNGIKPLHTDCNCWMESGIIMRAGRFGKWEKGVLVHQAFEEVFHAL